MISTPLQVEQKTTVFSSPFLEVVPFCYSEFLEKEKTKATNKTYKLASASYSRAVVPNFNNERIIIRD